LAHIYVADLFETSERDTNFNLLGYGNSEEARRRSTNNEMDDEDPNSQRKKMALDFAWKILDLMELAVEPTFMKVLFLLI
jgi:hypothetical protein